MYSCFKFFFLVLFISSSKLFGNEIKGIIVDSVSNLPLENATIKLSKFNQGDSLKITLSKSDGSFIFSNIDNGKYNMTVSYIGYQSKEIYLDLMNNSELVIKLINSTTVLNEVLISANKQLVYKEQGKIIYQIEGGIWQNSGSAQDIIGRIPIIKGRGSSFLLFGSKIVFLLDGKPMETPGFNLEMALANLTSTEIDKIEILQNPPQSLSRYGNTIINIKSNKLKDNGSLVNLTNSYGFSINHRFNNNVKYSFKKNEFLANFQFTHGIGWLTTKSESLRQIYEPSFSDFKDFDELLNKYNNGALKVGFEYSKPKIGSINFELQINNKNNNDHNFQKSVFDIDMKIDSIIILSEAQSRIHNNFINFDYKKKVSSLININLNIENCLYRNDNSQLFVFNNKNLENPWDRKISYNNIYLQNESQIKNLFITYGIYFKNSNSATNFLQSIDQSNASSINFSYKENLISYFSNAKRSYEKGELSFGLNLEQNRITGNSQVYYKQIKFINFLPTLNYNFNFSETSSIGVSYERGIIRPDFEWLNQQEVYKNPFFNHVGGGVLSPIIYDNINLTSTLNQNLTLTAIYSNQKNRFSFIPFITKENFISYSAINVDKYYYLYLSAAYEKDFSNWWHFSVDLSGYYSKTNSKTFQRVNSGVTYQLSTSNFFTINKQNKFGITTSYNSIDHSDLYDFLEQFSLNLDYNKSIFKGKVNLSCSLSDILNTIKDRYFYDYKQLKVLDKYKNETRRFRLVLSYKFGNNNVKDKAKPSISDSNSSRLN